ncbi:MAG: GIY-YIG nuclease family protein [Candidatus Paceibacterota bacterium]
MIIQDLKKVALPDTPGVYFFMLGKEVLYVGKATSLKDRVRSYFGKDLIETRGIRLVDMVSKADSVTFEKTDSVLEALILEAYYIKKLQPYYNAKEKDNKSFNYVVITKEEFPLVLQIRGRELATKFPKDQIHKVYGPFTSGTTLREALKIIRKIFPYFDKKCLPNPKRITLNHQLGLCPVEISATEYKKTVRNITYFFEGKKKLLLSTLERDMKMYAKKEQFEEAGVVQSQLYALKHIRDVSLLKDSFLKDATDEKALRIEAFDVAHMAGENVVGVMTVVEGGDSLQQEYKKFIIKGGTGNNDVAGLKEILTRRFKHEEWGLPDVVVVDGGVAQLRIGEKIVSEFFGEHDRPSVVGVVKDEFHRPKKLIGDKVIAKAYERDILLANNEAHRFAIAFHRKKRRFID